MAVSPHTETKSGNKLTHNDIERLHVDKIIEKMLNTIQKSNKEKGNCKNNADQRTRRVAKKRKSEQLITQRVDRG